LLNPEGDVKYPYYIFAPIDIIDLNYHENQKEVNSFHWKLKKFDAKVYRNKEKAIFQPGEEKLKFIPRMIYFKNANQ